MGLGARHFVARLLRHLDGALRAGGGAGLVAEPTVHVPQPEGPGGEQGRIAQARERRLLPEEHVHALPEAAQEVERVGVAQGDLDQAAVALPSLGQPLQPMAGQLQVL